MTLDNRSPEGGGPLDQVNWEEARARMRRVIAANLTRLVGPDELEDLAQDACIRVMRAVLRGPIDNQVALEVEIARRVAIDRMRWRPRTEPLPEKDLPMPLPELDDDELRPEDAQFYIQEIMRSLGGQCRELFEHWLTTLNLRLVAEKLGLSHATVRQRSVRCRDRARTICKSDDGPLGQWFRSRLESA